MKDDVIVLKDDLFDSYYLIKKQIEQIKVIIDSNGDLNEKQSKDIRNRINRLYSSIVELGNIISA